MQISYIFNRYLPQKGRLQTQKIMLTSDLRCESFHISICRCLCSVRIQQKIASQKGTKENENPLLVFIYKDVYVIILNTRQLFAIYKLNVNFDNKLMANRIHSICHWPVTSQNITILKKTYFYT